MADVEAVENLHVGKSIKLGVRMEHENALLFFFLTERKQNIQFSILLEGFSTASLGVSITSFD